jgi:urea transport system ATP-binding protein
VLAVKGLNQFYGGSHTLWDVDLTVPAGALICLMGRNGMGKTTLLKCIMGLLKTSSGSVTFDGTDLVKCRAEERARDRYRLRASGTRNLFPSHCGRKPEGWSGRA